MARICDQRVARENLFPNEYLANKTTLYPCFLLIHMGLACLKANGQNILHHESNLVKIGMYFALFGVKNMLK